jgi:hypothetical protein
LIADTRSLGGQIHYLLWAKRGGSSTGCSPAWPARSPESIHIGSTSVPSLPAERLIDIPVVVPGRSAAADVAKAAGRSGFVCIPCQWCRSAGRRPSGPGCRRRRSRLPGEISTSGRSPHRFGGRPCCPATDPKATDDRAISLPPSWNLAIDMPDYIAGSSFYQGGTSPARVGVGTPVSRPSSLERNLTCRSVSTTPDPLERWAVPCDGLVAAW